ncbi:MAG: DUF420 domain-containing protein [Saprospiraceae bacterium]|nr:DUF420 domain-containing protein [Saprospiraceae bacterium]
MSWSNSSIKKLNVFAYLVSAIVLLVVASMRQIKIESSIDFSFLPAFHSSLNAFCGVLLLIAYYFIRMKNIHAHKRFMTAAILCSSAFLISYVLYHVTTPEVRFCKEGGIRTIYFILLISHIVLSAFAFPFILFTYIRGLTHQHPAHERMARWVFPIWLYICFSGPACYLMLRPCMI